MTGSIRKAERADVSRIAEILIFAKRVRYRDIFHNDKVSFGEMQVVPLAQEYLSGALGLEPVWVYGDGFVRGMVHTENGQINELYVDPFFQGAGEKTALRIIGDLAEGKPLLYCATPMVRDSARLEAACTENARKIAALLDEGKTVAFITLGDPSVYSTYLYTHRQVLAMGYEAEIIPGVPSFWAAAALGGGLCEGGDRLLVVPASHRDVGDCLEVDVNYVFMKAGREIGKLRDTLAEHGLLDRAAMVENCGMETERVYPRFADAPEGSGYFSVVVVKRNGK